MLFLTKVKEQDGAGGKRQKVFCMTVQSRELQFLRGNELK